MTKHTEETGCALTREDFGSPEEHDEVLCADGGTYWEHESTVPHTENLTHPLQISKLSTGVVVASYPYSQEKEALDAVFGCSGYGLRDVPKYYREM